PLPALMRTPNPPDKAGRAIVPVGSVPRKFPEMVTLLAMVTEGETEISSTARLITRPRIVVFDALTVSPLLLEPFNSIRRTVLNGPGNPSAFALAAAPPLAGCVYPSMVTASVMSGRFDPRVIVCTPAPGMLKAIVSRPAEPAPHSFSITPDAAFKLAA